MTFGAGKVPVVPILDPVDQHKVAPIFGVTLIGIPGEHSENRPDHQRIAENHKYKPGNTLLQQRREQAGNQPGNQNYHIQPVCPVASGHKPAKSGAQLCAEVLQPISILFQRSLTLPNSPQRGN